LLHHEGHEVHEEIIKSKILFFPFVFFVVNFLLVAACPGKALQNFSTPQFVSIGK